MPTYKASEGGVPLKLDDVEEEVSSQLSEQSSLGIQITRINEVPEKGPANKGVWHQILNVSTVFADIKNSTALLAESKPEDAALAYTYFIRAMALVLERFGAKYIDIQGDAIFGLFSCTDSIYHSAACAITMRTHTETHVAAEFKKDTSTDWALEAGFGIDRGTLLVRRLGLRGTKENEVWAGKPVNIAAKLSDLATANQVVVSDRLFGRYEAATSLRKRALIWSCGCNGDVVGGGLDSEIGETCNLWTKEEAPDGLGLDFSHVHRLSSKWCTIHGAEFCEVLYTGKRP